VIQLVFGDAENRGQFFHFAAIGFIMIDEHGFFHNYSPRRFPPRQCGNALAQNIRKSITHSFYAAAVLYAHADRVRRLFVAGARRFRRQDLVVQE